MRIRHLEESDIAEVSKLFLQVTPEAQWPSAAACGDYLRELFFLNPWRELELPSWLAEDGGRVVAFYLLLPRSMEYRGAKLRVAVGCQMAVHPDYRHSMVALQLGKAVLSGPQDLTIADGASGRSRHMWQVLGGSVPLLYNLHWIRPLRPARLLIHAMQQRQVLPAPVVHLARPLAAPFDRAVSRLRWNRFSVDADGYTEDVLDETAILHGMEVVANGAQLKPAYDRESLAWLLRQLREKPDHDELRGRVVKASDGGIAGWYLYALRQGATSEVIQLAARRGNFDAVMNRLLADAWRKGAAAVRGRGEPGQVEALSARHCWFRREGKFTLVHARRKEISDAIEQGKAFLSRLDGEWCIRLVSG
jgi:hypothetical protein